jgi:hypothetical protein
LVHVNSSLRMIEQLPLGHHSQGDWAAILRPAGQLFSPQLL